MHRVFRPGGVAVGTASEAFDEVRALLRSFGLSESEAAGVYVYRLGARQVATLRGSMHSATLYLYPDALGRGAGVASSFYRTLDLAGLGMGSKLGPSVDLDLENAAHVALFREKLTALFTPAAPPSGLTAAARADTVAATIA